MQCPGFVQPDRTKQGPRKIIKKLIVRLLAVNIIYTKLKLKKNLTSMTVNTIETLKYYINIKLINEINITE